MKLGYFKLIFYTTLLFGFFAYGVAVGVYKVFPFEQVRYVKNIFFPNNFTEEVKPRAQIFEFFSPNAQIVFVGDSITQGGIWAEFFPQYSVANRGVSGDTAEDILRRMETIYSVNPDFAFLMVGINDLFRGFSVDEVFENYYWIIQNLRRRNIAVVIQSTFSCSVSVCGDRNLMVEELNMRLRDYAVSEQLVYVDINNVIADEGGLRTEVTYDGIHLNGLGYRLWVEVLTPVISELADD
jgi:lysophospholipase L1-like esterase